MGLTSDTAAGPNGCKLAGFTATSWPDSRRTFTQPGTSGHAEQVCGMITPAWPLSSKFFMRSRKTTLVYGGYVPASFSASPFAPLAPSAAGGGGASAGRRACRLLLPERPLLDRLRRRSRRSRLRLRLRLRSLRLRSRLRLRLRDREFFPFLSSLRPFLSSFRPRSLDLDLDLDRDLDLFFASFRSRLPLRLRSFERRPWRDLERRCLDLRDPDRFDLDRRRDLDRRDLDRRDLGRRDTERLGLGLGCSGLEGFGGDVRGRDLLSCDSECHHLGRRGGELVQALASSSAQASPAPIATERRVFVSPAPPYRAAPRPRTVRCTATAFLSAAGPACSPTWAMILFSKPGRALSVGSPGFVGTGATATALLS
mmetsp:Transcript_36300/g.102260  ORF Transcript_36300/g.102260 Transcript_36300/m.102260 type:complete len:369 (-) Transcript_36300:439-1545(-)